ncbi:ProQ/FinO family protein [Myxococcota bacterium]|nr:ProQ/FinO family protein [Myxococcota bacterium]
MASEKELKKEIVLQVYHGLKAKYRVFKEKKPLKFNIHLDVIADNRDIPEDYLREAIKWMVQSNDYLEGIARGGIRYDLRCKPWGKVEKKHVLYARDVLKKRALKRNWRNNRDKYEHKLTLAVEKGQIKSFGIEQKMVMHEDEQKRFKVKAWAELMDGRSVATSPNEHSNADKAGSEALRNLVALLEGLDVLS